MVKFDLTESNLCACCPNFSLLFGRGKFSLGKSDFRINGLICIDSIVSYRICAK